MTTVAVTGAARGIGEAIARDLARRGHDLLLGDLDGCAALAAELGAVEGVLDVTDQGSYVASVALVPQVDVNVGGVMRGTRLAIAGGARTIVTVASVASYIAPAGEATYAATKHAVLAG